MYNSGEPNSLMNDDYDTGFAGAMDSNQKTSFKPI